MHVQRIRGLLARILIVFSLVTLMWMVVKEVKKTEEKTLASSEMNQEKDGVWLYYLHGNVRCVTCKHMEEMTKEAIMGHFQEELKNGTLQFAVENFESPGNERFSKEYQIVSASVLLIHKEKGKTIRWKNLEEIWYLTDSKEKFQAYIINETSAFLQQKRAIEASTDKERFDISQEGPSKGSWAAFFLGVVSSFGLGLLTSISPCPLATNIAAISFLGKNVKRPFYVLTSGLFYSLGRMFSYIAVGLLLILGLLAVPAVSSFLTRYINSILSVLLILSGIFLLQWLELSWGTIFSADKWQTKAEKGGLVTSFILGSVFALAFCPTSAALFFGTLIPLTVKMESKVIMPLVYGFGTAVPVTVFAIVVALASQSMGKIFNKISVIEHWLRVITGFLFIIIGIYLALVYVFGVF